MQLGTQEAYAVPGGNFFETIFHGPSFLACFSETGRNDDGPPGADFAEFFQQGNDLTGWHDQDGQIRRFRQITNRGIGLMSQKRFFRWGESGIMCPDSHP